MTPRPLPQPSRQETHAHLRPDATWHTKLGLTLGCLVACAAVTLRGAASPLQDERSPFLREHAASPVAWMPWGDAAFARAKAENKPLFVAIGDFASELSQAMNRQSFSNADTAVLLNEQFVCVLVDRQERPDVAALYQTYIQTAKQLKGWPVNVWLTPDLKPMEGATYLPPSEEWGQEGFINVIKRVQAAWAADPAMQQTKGEDAVRMVEEAASPSTPEPATADYLAELLEENTAAWKALHDAENGGFGDPPRVVNPELLRYLLADTGTREMALESLRIMVRGAVRDQLDGGFFHRTVDAAWREPSFQKLLADQARMALALLDAARLSDDPVFATAARAALYYALDGLRKPDGSFVSVEDGTGGELPLTYLWTVKEVRDVLGGKEGDAFCAAFGMTAEGNASPDAYPGLDVAGRNLPYQAVPSLGDDVEKHSAAAARLLEKRRERGSVRMDNAATSGDHGLFLAALARAGAELKDERCAAGATDVFAIIRDKLVRDGSGLLRLPGGSIPAAADDYALVIDGLNTLHLATGNADAAGLANKLTNTLVAKFYDGASARLYATEAPLAPGVWARVHAPPPRAGDGSSAETAAIMALLASAKLSDQGVMVLEGLAAGVAAVVADSYEAPPGDQLLALQRYGQRLAASP